MMLGDFNFDIIYIYESKADFKYGSLQTLLRKTYLFFCLQF